MIINANIGQDSLQFQFGHDHYHFDNNSFQRSNRYCEELRQSVLSDIHKSDFVSCWNSFGKLTHTVQDLYAHSNYVNLWKKLNPGSSAELIDPVVDSVLSSKELRSGRLYYPLEILSFIKLLEPIVLPLLPKDSHAWMNIDAPGRPDFEFAKTAAVRRTLLEYKLIAEKISSDEKIKFSGNQ